MHLKQYSTVLSCSVLRILIKVKLLILSKASITLLTFWLCFPAVTESSVETAIWVGVSLLRKPLCFVWLFLVVCNFFLISKELIQMSYVYLCWHFLAPFFSYYFYYLTGILNRQYKITFNVWLLLPCLFTFNVVINMIVTVSFLFYYIVSFLLVFKLFKG